jgi:succinate dehydrogenase / fumarate reductase, cytochrome b subunit
MKCVGFAGVLRYLVHDAAPGRAKPATGAPRPAMFRGTVGLKLLMAISGVGLVGFALVHMLGHLQVFGGRDAYNHYAETLQGLGAIKWVVRLGLLGALAVHVACGVTLSRRNRAARPVGYTQRRMQRSTGYGRAMLLTGITFVAFLLYHLAHFTLGWVHGEYYDTFDAVGRPDVYGNFVRSFGNPAIVAAYVLASLAVSLHATHATSSMLRTLGVSQRRLRGACERAGAIVGVSLLAGFACVPLACLFGMVTP